MLVPAANCLMRYINDSRGTGKKANVVVVEAQVENLVVGGGYKLLEVIPISNIAPQSQLLLNHGSTFLTVNHVDDEGTPVAGDSKKKGESGAHFATPLQPRLGDYKSRTLSPMKTIWRRVKRQAMRKAVKGRKLNLK